MGLAFLLIIVLKEVFYNSVKGLFNVRSFKVYW